MTYTTRDSRSVINSESTLPAQVWLLRYSKALERLASVDEARELTGQEGAEIPCDVSPEEAVSRDLHFIRTRNMGKKKVGKIINVANEAAHIAKMEKAVIVAHLRHVALSMDHVAMICGDTNNLHFSFHIETVRSAIGSMEDHLTQEEVVLTRSSDEAKSRAIK